MARYYVLLDQDDVIYIKEHIDEVEDPRLKQILGKIVKHKKIVAT